MSQDDDRVASTIAEAEKLVADIQRQLDEGDEFCRQHGFDRESTIGSMSAKDKEESARLFAEDMAAVRREVEEEKARRSFAKPASGARPKHRTMI